LAVIITFGNPYRNRFIGLRAKQKKNSSAGTGMRLNFDWNIAKDVGVDDRALCGETPGINVNVWLANVRLK
jgi:hypothetical protein